MDSLKQLGVNEEVKRLFDNIKWGFFLEWPKVVNVDLVKEFYSNARDEAPCSVEFKLGDELNI